MKKNMYLLVVTILFVGLFVADTLASDTTVKFSGDIRGRWEAFWFDKDESGSQATNRHRLRYRLRMNVSASISPHAAAAIRIGTGDTDSRSANQTLGSPVDFGPSELDIRRAYLVIYPFANGTLPSRDGSWAFQFGRVPNPNLWKKTVDMMLWDSDIDFGGMSTTFDIAATEKVGIFANGGAFVVEENKVERDAYMTSLQGGLDGKVSDNVQLGGRGSWYYFGNVDEDFIARGVDGTGGVTSAGGNIVDGLTGSAKGGDVSVVETQLFVKITTEFPVTAFGGFSDNLSAAASDSVPVDKESTAFNIGIEGGDRKKSVQIGGAYFSIRANAFPSQFVDGDILDGRTNRYGFLVYLARALWKGADFKTTLFKSDVIESGPGFGDSVKDSKRTRLQVDLVYKF